MLKFRRLLEEKGLCKALFERINELLRERGLLMNRGTMVDATIIEAPSSTKNKAKQRDPEMHQTRKGNQWHFGAKAHIGADIDSGLVHTVECTAANTGDVTQTHLLLHGEEESVFADAGYTGADKREELQEVEVEWHIAERRSKVERIEHPELKELTEQREHVRAKIRARVEHPFHIVKNLFGLRKLRYKGLKKNAAQLHVLFGLGNLLIAKKALLA